MIALMGLSLIGASAWAIFFASLSQDIGQSHRSNSGPGKRNDG